ncbi:hypothetical protein [Malaciobacter marinus]|nr:hypothetical protein [Malaciobacter marinus]
MKLGDILFWLVLAIIATFYLLKGNNMHKQIEDKKLQKIEQKQQKD